MTTEATDPSDSKPLPGLEDAPSITWSDPDSELEAGPATADLPSSGAPGSALWTDAEPEPGAEITASATTASAKPWATRSRRESPSST